MPSDHELNWKFERKILSATM